MPDDYFRWVIAIGVFLSLLVFGVQTVMVWGMYRATKAMQEKLTPIIDATGPLVKTVRYFADENFPKFSQMTTDATEVVKSLHSQVDRLSEVVKDVTDRARAQVARIDGAVDLTVDQVQNASASVKDAVLRPVRQVDGIMQGIRAAVSVMAQGRRESVDHATQDEEMFI
jgi:methyl-accepting chemotaxis protein